VSNIDKVLYVRFQLRSVVDLEELTKNLPPDYQVDNSLAVIATLILGPRLLTAVSRVDNANVDPEGLH
jgi:hypothetical protein